MFLRLLIEHGINCSGFLPRNWHFQFSVANKIYFVNYQFVISRNLPKNCNIQERSTSITASETRLPPSILFTFFHVLESQTRKALNLNLFHILEIQNSYILRPFFFPLPCMHIIFNCVSNLPFFYIFCFVLPC